MNRIKRHLLVKVVLVALSMMLVLASIPGITVLAKSPVEISMWFSIGGEPGKATQALVKSFNQLQEEVKVNAVYCGTYDDTMQKLLAAIAAGVPPTIAHIAHAYAPQMVIKGHIQFLDDFIVRDPEVSKADFLYKVGIYQEKLYGIPFNCSNPIMFYNKDMFRQAGLDPEKTPKTWDELYNTAARISTLGDEIRGFDIEPGYMLFGYLWQFAGEWIKPDNSRVLWDSEESIAALSFMKKMVDDGVACYRGGKKTFVAGKRIGMIFQSCSSLTYMIEHCPFDLGVAVQPSGVREMVPLGGGGLYMFKDTSEEEKQAAWKFLRYLTNPVNQMFWAMSTGYLASNAKALKSALMEKIFTDDPRFQVPYLQLPYSRIENDTQLVPYMEIKNMFYDAWDRCVLGGEDATETMKEATENANKVLREQGY